MEKISPIFIALSWFFVACTPKSQGPVEWQSWVKKSQERFQQKFANPTITHHIYFDRQPQKAWVDTSGPYIRLTLQECADCKWSVERISEKTLKIISGKNQLDLPTKQHMALPGQQRFYVSAHYYEQDHKIRLFVHDLEMPKLDQKRQRKFFTYDPQLKVQAKFQNNPQPKPIKVMRSDGSHKFYRVVAFLQLPEILGGSKLSVLNYGDGQDYLQEKMTMLLFRDFSNGKSTYGAGRFLNVDFGKAMVNLKDGDAVTVDFNFSYNPPCAVSTGFHCPLPQDTVAFSVEAGEQYQ